MKATRSSTTTTPRPSKRTVCGSVSVDDRLHQLQELRVKAKQTLTEGDLDAWFVALGQAIRAAAQLRKYLLAHPVVALKNASLRPLISQLVEVDDDDDESIAPEVFFSRFGPKDYFARLVEVNTLVVPVSFPKTLSAFCEEARQCYALGLDIAVHSLSRTILEVAVNDIATRLGRIPANSVTNEKNRPIMMRRRVRAIAGKRHEEVYTHYRRLCAVVHGRSLASGRGALTTLVETHSFVSLLYQHNAYRLNQREQK